MAPERELWARVGGFERSLCASQKRREGVDVEEAQGVDLEAQGVDLEAQAVDVEAHGEVLEVDHGLAVTIATLVLHLSRPSALECGRHSFQAATFF